MTRVEARTKIMDCASKLMRTRRNYDSMAKEEKDSFDSKFDIVSELVDEMDEGIKRAAVSAKKTSKKDEKSATPSDAAPMNEPFQL